MLPILFRSGRRLEEADIQALAEYLQAADPSETHLHRLFETHPAIIGVLGFIEFLSEFPLIKRDHGNQTVIDPRYFDRADILAARLDIAPDLRARKFANIIELKGANARVLDAKSRRRSPVLSSAINQVRDYSHWLSELPANRTLLASLGWDVWRPCKMLIMGSRAEFRDPGQLEQLKQELLETDGVQLILTDELLALAEMARRRSLEGAQTTTVESLFGLNDSGRFLASLIVASGGLAGFMLARRRIDGAVTSYGNVDIREAIPSGLVHLTQRRLQPLARKLGVPFAEAVVGFNKFRRNGFQMYGPVKSGIVVADFDAQAIRSAFEQREARNQPLREKATHRNQQKRQTQNELARLFAERVRSMFPRLPAPLATKLLDARHFPIAAGLAPIQRCAPKRRSGLRLRPMQHMSTLASLRERKLTNLNSRFVTCCLPGADPSQPGFCVLPFDDSCLDGGSRCFRA
jgi:Rad4 beta-hairpin domain 3/Domain of unknown function (DUF4263)